MMLDSGPDKNADYWEEKDRIRECLDKLAIISNNL